MMKLLIVAVVLAPIGASGFGFAPITHSGNVSPTAEGWTEYLGDGTSVGPLTNDLGYDAWFTNDYSGSALGQSCAYGVSLSPSDIDSLQATGWKMSARARAPGQTSSAYAAALYFDLGVNRFAISLTRDADGKTFASTPSGTDWDQATRHEITEGYHLHELVYRGGSASFYIDGVLVQANVTGDLYSDGNRYIAFGSGTSYGTGQGNWNYVSLEAVPEPATLLALGLGAVGVICRKRRK